MRVTASRPDVGIPVQYADIRELTDADRAAFEDAIETIGAFGATWGHYRLVDAAEGVSNAVTQLAANAKAADGRINNHDLDRVRWTIAEFASEAASRMADGATKGGGCADAVAAVAPNVLARWCEHVAGGAQPGLVAGDMDGEPLVAITGIDDLEPGQAMTAMEVVSGILQLCTRISDAELLAAEPELEAACRVLMGAVAEVMWGRPVLATIPSVRTDDGVSFTPMDLPLEMVPHVLGACQLARARADAAAGPAPAPPGRGQAAGPPGGVTAEPADPGTPAGADAPGGIADPPDGSDSDEAVEEPEGESTPGDVRTIDPAVDLVALAREAVAIASETEQAWSGALSELRVPVIADITGRVTSLLNALYREVMVRQAADEAAGHSTRLPGVPTPVDNANAFEEEPTGQQSVIQQGLAMVHAIEELVSALAGLRAPDRTSINVVDGSERSWWSHEGFMRVRTAAEMAIRVVVEPPPEVEYQRGVEMTLALNAWNAGLPEAALVYLSASLDPAVASTPAAEVFALTKTVAAAIGNGEQVSLNVVIPVVRFWFDHLQFRSEPVTDPADRDAASGTADEADEDAPD